MVATAICVAMASVLVAQAAGYTRYVTNFGGTGSDAAFLRLPGGIAVSPDGSRVYVADTGNERIDEFNADGSKFLRAWGYGVADGKSVLETCTEATGCLEGQNGRGEGQLNQPSAVAVAPDGTVYVLNRAKGDGRVQAFDPSSEEVAYAGTVAPGYGEGEENFTYPLPYSSDLVVGPDGRVYVGDESSSGHRIVIFDPAAGTFESVQIPEVEALAAFAPFTIEPTTEEPNPAERIWVASTYGTPYLFKHAEGSPEAELVTRAGGEGSFNALAVQPETNVLLAESSGYSGEEKTLTEFDEAGNPIGQIAVTGMTPSNEPPSAYGLAINPNFRYSNKYVPPSEEGVIYVVNRFNGTVNVLAEAAPGEPAVELGSPEDIGSTGATLVGRVNPTGFDAHAYFEYGTTTAYGSTSPAPPGPDLGSGFVSKTVSPHLYGLQPDTTYHYRLVATSPAGTKVSDDATFTTYPVGGPLSLPDGRAYEQVTTEKGPANVEGLFAAPGGDGVAFQSESPLPGSASGSLFTAYVGFRSPAGWQAESASPPVEDTLEVNRSISPDLRQSIGFSSKNVTGDAPPGSNLYLRDNATGAETLMTPYSRGTTYRNYEMFGFSADYSRIFFESLSALTPDTPEPETAGEYRPALYEWHAGALRNVGILPGATTPTARAIQSAPSYENLHSVSEDGSKVFFLTEPAPKEAGETNANQLYVRIDGNRTVEASAPAPGVEDSEAAAQNPTFVGAAADGSAAFFTSSARLTADANTGTPGDREPNLYRYDVGSGRLVDLSVADEQADEELGAAVGGVAAAGNGKSAYFVAKGNLAAGGVSGRLNLYRWTEGQGVKFVLDLGEKDPLVNGPGSFRVTADGSVLVFNSAEALDPSYPGAKSVPEIYRYSAADGSTVCISCMRAGNGGQMSAEITAPTPLAGGYGGNVLSSDGSRVFFQTSAALVPQDTNGRTDVYEWENGSAHLITTGAGESDFRLVDASANGDDVFFATENRLIPGDRDGYVDVYDAKVGGGLPGPAETTPCEGQGCRTAEAAPTESSIGSRSLNGPGNKKAKHHRKKHHKHKKHRRHAKHRKQKRSHGHPAVGKRG